MLEVLSPGVEHTQETDLCAKMLRIGGDLQQGCSAGAEQEVVDDLLILQGQPRQLVGDGEDDMNVVVGPVESRIGSTIPRASEFSSIVTAYLVLPGRPDLNFPTESVPFAFASTWSHQYCICSP